MYKSILRSTYLQFCKLYFIYKNFFNSFVNNKLITYRFKK